MRTVFNLSRITKRKLSLWIAITMIVGLINSILGATTVANAAVNMDDVIGTQYEDTAYRLSAFGLMVGDNIGFRPDDPIKRSEFAAIVVRMAGMEDLSKTVDGSGTFQDVPNTHWAFGYVETAYKLGIIRGISESSFAPDANITYEQAVTMIVRLLGYEPMATARGGFPVGYMVIADENDITKKISAESDMTTTRGIVAKLIDNSLSVPMMTKTQGAKSKYVVSGTQGTDKQRILEDYLHMECYRVWINSVETLEDGTNRVKVKILDPDNDLPEKYNHHDNEVVTFNTLEMVSTVGILNTEVVIWEKNEVIYSLSKAGSGFGNTLKPESEVVFDYIDEVDGLENGTPKPLSGIHEIKLKNADEEYDLTSTTEIYYNNQNEKATVKLSETFENLPLLTGSFVKAVVDGKILKKLYIYQLSQKSIITGITSDSITCTQGDLKDFQLAGIKDAESIEVVLDGKTVPYSNLLNDMLIGFWHVDKDFLVVASSEKLDGKFQAYSDTRIKVDDQLYDLSSTVYYSTNFGTDFSLNDQKANLVSSDVVCYVWGDGNISYIKGSWEDTAFYGVVVSASSEGGNGLKIFRKTASGGENVNYALDLKNSSVDFATAKGNAANVDGKGVYKFTLNSRGKIEKIEEIAWMSSVAGGYDFPMNVFRAGIYNPEIDDYIVWTGAYAQTATNKYYSGQVVGFDSGNKKITVSKYKLADAVPTSAPYYQFEGKIKKQYDVNPLTNMFRDKDGNDIDIKDVLKTPEKLVPINWTWDASTDIYFPKEVSFFNLTDRDGKFKPTVVNFADVSGKLSSGVSMKIGNPTNDISQLLSTDIAVILNGSYTIITNTSRRIGFVLDSPVKISKDTYILKVQTEEGPIKTYTLNKDYFKDENGNAPQKNSFIAYRLGGNITEIDDDDDDEGPQVDSDGTMMIMHVYPSQLMVDKTSGYRYNPIDTQFEDRVCDKVYYRDSSAIVLDIGLGTSKTFNYLNNAKSSIMVYEYDPKTKEAKKSTVSTINLLTDKVWYFYRYYYIRGILFIKGK